MSGLNQAPYFIRHTIDSDLAAFLHQRLHSGKPRGISDDREAACEHGEDGDQGVQKSGDRQRNRQRIVKKSKEKILTDDFAGQHGKVSGIQNAGGIGS